MPYPPLRKVPRRDPSRMHSLLRHRRPSHPGHPTPQALRQACILRQEHRLRTFLLQEALRRLQGLPRRSSLTSQLKQRRHRCDTLKPSGPLSTDRGMRPVPPTIHPQRPMSLCLTRCYSPLGAQVPRRQRFSALRTGYRPHLLFSRLFH